MAAEDNLGVQFSAHKTPLLPDDRDDLHMGHLAHLKSLGEYDAFDLRPTRTHQGRKRR